jgi:glutamate--cysteine ligase
VVTGRYRQAGDVHGGLTATVAGPAEARSVDWPVTLPARDETNGFIPRVWGTRKVGYLLDEIRLRGENAELKDEVIRLSKEYGIMTPYMDKVGTLGTSMMYRSCTVQANLDFSDEADMVRKMRVSLALQPIVTALFANSPVLDGKPSGYLRFRSQIWLDTDRARTGMLPFAFRDGFGFDAYAEHALDVPMYFVIRNGQYINTSGESFRAFMRGELPQLPGVRPTVKDWENHLSTLFPEVRLKQFLEMRGADMGDRDHVLALAAIWAGLLYDQSSLDAAWDLVEDWTDEERETLRNEVPRTALATKFRQGTVADIARLAVDLATDGLRRRRHILGSDDETLYLRPLEHTLDTGKTQADRWLEKYHGEWQGDLTRIFDEAEM